MKMVKRNSATNGFSSTNLIGVGGFGSVYRGILDQGRYTVAVKVLNLLLHGASKSFITECGALRSVRHQNLVKIVSACSSVDFQGHEFKALVYEFMSNGSLDEWLHLATRTNNVPEKPKNLNLLQRLNIVIDVANALDYLHHHCHTPIIHCDLKPSNVLLDDEMIGHISDFGLVRFLFEDTHDCFSNQSSSIVFRGIMGYAPPDKNVAVPNFNLVNQPSLDKILKAEVFVHNDGQLRVAHLILGYTPISKSYQALKCIIKVNDPRLHWISVAALGFLITDSILEGTLTTDPILEGIPKVALLPQPTTREATSSHPAITKEEEEKEEKAVQAMFRAEEITNFCHRQMKEEEGRRNAAVEAFNLAEKRISEMKCKIYLPEGVYPIVPLTPIELD
ncbi:probable LRR receptor-like serine/threonine-protein kinase At3g47570 [Quercus lobata]|uniref:probable LRR receptor-like serine/threonine-protein kinase At3g47570 n=1 Tax=Quercus lobata TaxID=97700 RepID=UPI0012488CF8|nr:probable LRR receptor-like serine/threonine-protein kinase At3g47570 [Quercus lobata]